MKHLLVIAALVSTAACAQPSAYISSGVSTKTHLPRVPKVKLLRSNPHRLAAIRLQGTDPYDAPDDEFLCNTVARRPKIAKPDDQPNDQLSDYVTVRLAVARARAMQKYREAQA